MLINKNEIIINECQMFIEELINSFLNKSLKYQLCSLLNNQCFNITIKDEINFKLIQNKNFLFSIKLIELIILIVSFIFILITIILILIIFKLKQIKFSFQFKKNNIQQHLSSFKRKVCFDFILLFY